MTKYIFVTGGVVSSLGKGITAASLGRLLKSRGYKVTIQKFDPAWVIPEQSKSTRTRAEVTKVMVTARGLGRDFRCRVIRLAAHTSRPLARPQAR